MYRPSLHLLTGISLLTVLMSACDDGTGPSKPGMNVVRVTLRDTVGGIHPLDVVVLTAAGLAAGQVEVQFQPLFTGADGESRVYVHRTDDSVFRFDAVDTTDPSGLVTVQTQHGFTTGTAGLRINVPALGYADTPWFSIDPGRATGVRVAPADTAVYAARQFVLRPYTVDRFRNRRPDSSFQFSTLSGPVTVSAAGTVSTTDIGRAILVVRTSQFTDTAKVSVVPQGWVATQKFYAGNGGPEGIFLVQLDGSGRDSLTSGLDNSFIPQGFAWSRDGQQLVLTRGGTLYLLQPGGTEQPFVTMTGSLNTAARFSADGQWVYFALAYGSDTERAGLYRVGRDGSALAHIGDDTSHFGVDYFAAPSHDGQSVAYSSTRSPCGVETCIRVLDIATNRDRMYGTQDYLVHGAMAAWSPVEDLIAFNSGIALSLIHSDGTALRLLASDVGYVKWMDWSPDGEWLIVADDRGVELFGVHRGGLRLPLAQFLSYGATSWRP